MLLIVVEKALSQCRKDAFHLSSVRLANWQSQMIHSQNKCLNTKTCQQWTENQAMGQIIDHVRITCGLLASGTSTLFFGIVAVLEAASPSASLSISILSAWTYAVMSTGSAYPLLMFANLMVNIRIVLNMQNTRHPHPWLFGMHT